MKIELNYRRLFSFIIILLFLTSNAFSQDKKIGFGLQGSPQITWIKPDDDQKIKNDAVKGGFGYGLMFDFRFGQNYSLMTGINVLGSSGRLEYQDSLEYPFVHNGTKTALPPSTITYKLGYLELPITLLLKTNEIGYMTYFGQFGLASQFRLKVKGDVIGGGNIANEDLSEEIKFINMGLVIGGGFEYSLGGNTALVVALMYNNGFADILKDKEKATLKSLSLKLGVMF